MPKPSSAPGPHSEDRKTRSGDGERNNSKGEATRRLIMLTAERLFAEHGIAAVPLRDIRIAAGQKNNFAVQYHFGDREALVTAIISYRAAASEAGRVKMLAALLAEGQQPTVSDLVKVFVHPLARHLEDDNHYLAFLSRYIIERGGYSGLENVVPLGAIITLRPTLAHLLPNYPEHVLEERWTITMTSTIHTLARYQVLGRTGRLPAPIDDLLVELERYLTAGLEAPYEASTKPAKVNGTRPGLRRAATSG